MSATLLKRVLAISAVGWLVGSAQAQRARPNMRTIDSRHGLSSEQVNAIVKDRQGYLWIGTGDGLNRYDGRTLKVYRAGTSKTGPPHDHVNALACDSSGLLYIGCNAPYLCIWDPRQDTALQVPLPPGQSGGATDVAITCVFIDGQQRVWLGHGRRSWSRYDPRTRSFTTTLIHTDYGNPANRDMITDAMEDRDGTLWLSSQFGVVRFDPSNNRYRHVPNSLGVPGDDLGARDHIHALADEGQTVIAATGSGLFRFNKVSGVFTRLWGREGEWTNSVTGLARIDDQHLWAGTAQKGLLQVTLATSEVQVCDRSLNEDRLKDRTPAVYDVRTMYGDEERNIWIGTGRNGITLIAARENRFEPVSLPPTQFGIYPYQPIGFSMMPDGSTMMVTNTDGTFIIDPSSRLRKWIAPPAGLGQWDYMNDLVAVGGGRAIVTSFKGLWEVDPRCSTYRRPRWLVKGSPLEHATGSITLDGGNGFWISTPKTGILRVDTLTGALHSLLDVAPGIAPHLVGNLRLLWVDHRNWLWVVFVDQPVVVVKPDGRFFTIDKGSGPGALPDVFLTALLETRDGGIWAASWMHGLFRLGIDSTGLVSSDRVSTDHGLPSNIVYSIVRDGEDNIWGATKTGLFRLRPADGAVMTFGRGDGLPDMDRNLPIALIDHRLIVGFAEGYVVGDTRDLTSPGRAPNVFVPQVNVFDQERWRSPDLSQARIELAHDEHQLTFTLRTSNLVDPIRDRIAYRLMGGDTTWTSGGLEDHIAFSHLPPGHYALQVKARTADGPWGEMTAVPFIIHPPWWATWWGRVLSVLGFAVLMYVVFRALLKRRLRDQRELLERERAVAAERMRIANDMHDDIGSGLSVIKVKSEIALMNEKDPQRVKELARIAATSNELIDNMRQLVWSIGGGQESLQDLLSYVRSSAGEYLEAHGIGFSATMDGTAPAIRVGAAVRHDVLLLVKESLHNVVKHAKATHVEVRIGARDGLHITIADDGLGAMNGSATKPGHGVGGRTLEARTSALGGSFHREFGTGTTVRFHFPPNAIDQWAERPTGPSNV